MVFLVVCIIAFIFVPVFIMITQFGPHFSYNTRVETVVEGASLVAANDLSRIVFNDPNFGYVSLSNYPPVGKGTRALDGEPLPVIGINTLVGTFRQNALVVRQLENDTMSSLLDADVYNLAGTVNSLNAKLKDSLSPTRKGICFDIDGNVVDPVKDVKAFIAANLPPDVKVEAVKLSRGWLQGGSTTTIDAPQPSQLAEVRDKDIQAGKYRAFTEIPVGKKSFTFAGLGTNSSLVNKSEFEEADGKHICSIVKVECTVVLQQAPFTKIECVACSQPYSNPDLEVGGAMTVRFSGRPVTGLLSWSDFLTVGNFHDNKVMTYDVINGDYPFEKEAKMRRIKLESPPDTSEQFAEHLYCWLRNGRLRPRLDAIIAMINEPFRPCLKEAYAYEFANNGSISRRIIDADRLPRSVTADGQCTAVVDTRLRTGVSPVLIFRDNVRHLGTENGGKHAGQPLAGYPLNGEMQELANNQQMALNFSKRSDHPGGLAVDIEVGGTGDSTAARDVLSMRMRTRSRKI